MTLTTAGAPADGFVDANGARLRFEARGEGPALVLLHAGIADRRMWEDAARELSRAFRVVTYDLRGFGESTMPPGLFSHVEDLRALQDALGVARAHLCGVSFGGRIAIEFAIRYPLRVASLALSSPALGGYAWSKEMVAYGERSEALAARGDLDALVALDLQMWLAGPRRTLASMDGALAARLAPWVRGANARWAEQAKGTAQWLDPAAALRLRAVRTPTLIIVGSADLGDFLSIAGKLGREVQGAQTKVVAGAGHLVPLERPDEFLALLGGFLPRSGALPTVRAAHG